MFRPSRVPSPRSRHASFACLALAFSLPTVAVACKESAPPEPTPPPVRTETPAVGSASPSGAFAGKTARVAPSARPTPQKMKVSAKPVASVAPATDDPLKGVFTLADATKDIAGKGTLVATIETDLGALQCELFEEKAPITVANFVGLATGRRPFKNPDKKWVKKPAYEGTIFHRIIKGFMIQGGDSAGTGAGEPGYVIPDEIWEDANHDRPGLLCMANRGPNTNGQQFFITDAAAHHLDRGYTIFGECAPVETVHKIAAIEVKGERPSTPPKIKKITFKRGPSPLAAASGSASASAPKAPAPAASEADKPATTDRLLLLGLGAAEPCPGGPRPPRSAKLRTQVCEIRRGCEIVFASSPHEKSGQFAASIGGGVGPTNASRRSQHGAPPRDLRYQARCPRREDPCEDDLQGASNQRSRREGSDVARRRAARAGQLRGSRPPGLTRQVSGPAAGRGTRYCAMGPRGRGQAGSAAGVLPGGAAAGTHNLADE